MGEVLFRRLDAFMAGFRERIDPAMARTISDATDVLRASGMLARVPKVGDVAPPFELADQQGRVVSLHRLVEKGPVVVTFFRGGWCPFCTLALRALNEIARDTRRAGAEIVAISPETSDHAAATVERNDLLFPLLADPGNSVARDYGLAWELGPELRDVYARLGHILPSINGTNDWSLPVPAGFVIGSNGRIVYAHADADLRRRLEPFAALEAVRRAGCPSESQVEGVSSGA